MKNTTELTKIITQNPVDFLSALSKASGGMVNCKTMTNILMEHGLLSDKKRTTWFSTTSSIKFSDFCLSNGLIEFPNATNVSLIDGEYVRDVVEGNQGARNSYNLAINTLQVINIAKDTQELKDILLKIKPVESLEIMHNFTNAVSIPAFFKKYFGLSFGEWEKLKGFDASDLSPVFSLSVLPAYFSLKVSKGDKWRQYFLHEVASLAKAKLKDKDPRKPLMQYDESFVEDFKNDCPEQRQQGVNALVALINS